MGFMGAPDQYRFPDASETAINKLEMIISMLTDSGPEAPAEMFMIMFTVFGNTMATYCGQNLEQERSTGSKKGSGLRFSDTCIWCNNFRIVASYTIGDKLIYLVTGTHNENVMLKCDQISEI